MTPPDTCFEIRSEAEHAPSRSRRISTILNLYESAGKKYLFLWNLNARVGGGGRNRALWFSQQAVLTTAPAPNKGYLSGFITGYRPFTAQARIYTTSNQHLLAQYPTFYEDDVILVKDKYMTPLRCKYLMLSRVHISVILPPVRHTGCYQDFFAFFDFLGCYHVYVWHFSRDVELVLV